MKLKTLIVTVLILAALSAVVFIAHRPAPPAAADTRIGQPVIDQATIEKAAKLRLSDQGKTVVFVRQPDGSWRVASYFDLPADFAKLSGLVSNLTDAKLERLVTSNAERIARLEFKDTKVELLDPTDKEVWALTIGKAPESGTGRFVRFGTEQKAYFASLNAWLDTDAKNWADPQLLSLKPEDVAKIEIPFPEGGSVALARAKKDEAWSADKTPSGQRVKVEKVSALLSSLAGMRFSDTAETGDASATVARANSRTFKLTTFDGKTISVTLGRKPEEKKLKPPVADSKSGPAALGTATELLKKDDKTPGNSAAKIEPAKPLAPEFETIPAGPVFVFIANSDAPAPINALMQKRAFEIPEYTFTGLPQKPGELFEPAPIAPPPAAPAGKATEAPTK